MSFRLISYDSHIRAKIGKASFPLPSALMECPQSEFYASLWYNLHQRLIEYQRCSAKR